MIFTRDSLSNVVCNIRIPMGGKEEIGTGIFIAKNDEPYLLTASHVVANMNSQAYAVLSDTNGVPTKVSLSILLGGSAFVNHSQADLSYAKILLTKTNEQYLKGRCFPYEKQIDTSSNPLSKDIEFTTVGFPLGLGKIFTFDIQILCCSTSHYTAKIRQ